MTRDIRRCSEASVVRWPRPFSRRSWRASLVAAAACSALLWPGPLPAPASVPPGLSPAGATPAGVRAGRSRPATDSARIVWDEWGVPHIYAPSDQAMGFAFGWAQAREHGDALLRLYGLARGRAAEYWGERYLASDRLVRALDLPGLGARQVEALPDPLRRYVRAFARGIDAYARAHPEAVADSLEPVLPVTAGDVLAHQDRALFTFVAVTGTEPPPVGIDGLPAAARGGGSAGSNTWAIGATRSASGHAMLLQNPHLPWDPDLMHFTEAQLASPGGEVYGVTLIGLPEIAIGFNRYLGWSHTVNTVDALDTYRLSLARGGYRWMGGIRAFTTRADTLRVKEPDGHLRLVPITLRRSVQGPVIGGDDTTAIAVRTTGLVAGRTLREWWDMGRAHDLSSFEDALREMGLPMFNVSYADRDGHILYFFAGRVPRRSHGDFAYWTHTLPGDSAADVWHDVLSFDSLPILVDPPSDFIQNSNSPPWFATLPRRLDPADFPAYLAPVWLDMREERGLTMLTADSSITYDELVTMRYSNRMGLADRVLPDLLAAARSSDDTLAVRAAGVLARWDRSADADSRGAVLFDAWVRRALPRHGRFYARSWRPDAPLATPSGVADPAAAVRALSAAAKEVQGRWGSLDVPWGRVHRLEEDLPGSGASGDPFGIFHVIDWAPGPDGKTERPVAGDTWVAAIEFTPDGPRATAILTYGNTTRPGSPHFRDQLRLESEKRMRPVWTTPAGVRAHSEETQTVGEAHHEETGASEGGGH